MEICGRRIGFNAINVSIGNLVNINGSILRLDQAFDLQDEEDEKKVFGIAYRRGFVNRRLQLTHLAISSSESFIVIQIPPIESIVNHGLPIPPNIDNVVTPSQSIFNLLNGERSTFVGFGMENLRDDLMMLNLEPANIEDLGDVLSCNNIGNGVRKIHKTHGLFKADDVDSKVAADAVLSLHLLLQS